MSHNVSPSMLRLGQISTRRLVKVIAAHLHARDPHCRYCGRFLSERNYTVDHVLPLGRGGANDPRNVTVCCGTCNASKAGLRLDEWREQLLTCLANVDAMLTEGGCA